MCFTPISSHLNFPCLSNSYDIYFYFLFGNPVDQWDTQTKLHFPTVKSHGNTLQLKSALLICSCVLINLRICFFSRCIEPQTKLKSMSIIYTTAIALWSICTSFSFSRLLLFNYLIPISLIREICHRILNWLPAFCSFIYFIYEFKCVWALSLYYCFFYQLNIFLYSLSNSLLHSFFIPIVYTLYTHFVNVSWTLIQADKTRQIQTPAN